MQKQWHIQNVEFVGSFPKAPAQTSYPEIAFVGRSNVGKSSAINRLLNRKKSARVSSRPGRTQAINVFELDKRLRFIDLPGYGFAKAPKSVRQQWAKMIDGYLFNRAQLKLIVVLVDSRHAAQELDIQMLDSLQGFDLPYQVVATKYDTLKRSKAKAQLSKLGQGLGVALPDIVEFYSVTGLGMDRLWTEIVLAANL